MAGTKITEQTLHTIAHLAKYGFSQAFIAHAIKLSPSRLSEWKSENSEVADALNVSTDDLLSNVKANMFRIALDGVDKDATGVGMKLLDKYETVDVEANDVPTDTEVRDEILGDLNGK